MLALPRNSRRVIKLKMTDMQILAIISSHFIAISSWLCGIVHSLRYLDGGVSSSGWQWYLITTFMFACMLVFINFWPGSKS